MSTDEAIDALFAGPPESFVAERDALARTLKEAGRTDEAAAVKALRRPTVAASALNRLAHERASSLEALDELARDLRKAQRGALSGLRGTALREAVKRRRAVVDRLADEAVGLLETEGRGGEAQREAITRTLEAAAADADALEALRAGRLEKELQRPTGFGDLGGLVAVPGGADDNGDDDGDEVSTEPRAKASKTNRVGAKPAKAATPTEDPRLRRLRVQRDEAADSARAAAQSAVRAGERAVDAEREAEQAAVEIERLERDVRAAKRRQRQASEAAAQAASALKKTEADAERARKRVEDLQARIERLLG